MASRNRRFTVGYGGEICGTSNGGSQTTPYFPGVHACIDETHPGPPYHSGGPLSVSKRQVFIHRFDRLNVFYHSSLGWYNGKMGVRPYIPAVEPVALPLSGWGAIGWRRTQPLHPIMDLGVSIAEMRDIPKMIRQIQGALKALASIPQNFNPAKMTVGDLLSQGSSLPKKAGDTYLFGAFGLLPTLRDLVGVYNLREKLDRKISWLRKKNGSSIRRKVELYSEEYSESIARSIAPSSNCFPVLSSFLYAAGQTTSVSNPVLKSYQRRIWYSAKYRIFIPELSKDPRVPPPTGLVLDLLGLVPSPGVLYQALPWSWLLDWFTSVGDVLSNVWTRMSSHVVAQYAYVMGSETLTYKNSAVIVMHSGTYNLGWKDPDRTFRGVSTTVYKFRTREVANPYGFGLTYASLSLYQWSILAALGLSRVRPGRA